MSEGYFAHSVRPIEFQRFSGIERFIASDQPTLFFVGFMFLIRDTEQDIESALKDTRNSDSFLLARSHLLVFRRFE